MTDLLEIDSRSLTARIVIVVAIIGFLFCGYLAVKWQLGNMFANLTELDDPNAPSIANLAYSLAPADPSTSWFLGALVQNAVLDAEETPLTWFEQTVRLAPNDFRWRIEYARALASAGETATAEFQFRRALDLAPNYAYPRWHYANFLLRLGREEEAIAELKLAASNNDIYREQVFSLLWDYYEKDPEPLEAIVTDDPEARSRLAFFFASRGRGTDALRNWNMLSDEERDTRQSVAIAIAHGLYQQKIYTQALSFATQVGIDADAKPSKVTNPSFESGLERSEDSRFGWRIDRSEPRVNISIDVQQASEGSKSLRVSFRGYSKPTLSNVVQTVVVDPETEYVLRAKVRTKDVKSSGRPMLDIVNTSEYSGLARSAPFEETWEDWSQIELRFTTPPDCFAIDIRTIREYCGEDCPISGTFWYDDFELIKF